MDTELLQHPMRVLHLEDNENDHELVVATLLAEGFKFDFTLARSRPEFIKALQDDGHDLIISDYSLPAYDGLSALAAARELSPATPFIFFSGTIGEEVAVESLKNGAVDYVLKQKPGRLGAAVRHALRTAAERAKRKKVEEALRESEERFRVVARATNDVVWEWRVQANQVWFSGNFETCFGHATENAGIPSEQWFDFIHPDDKGKVVSSIAGLLATGGKVWWSEHRIRRANGSYAHIFDRASVIYDAEGRPQRMVGVKIDMSERRQAEEKIREQAALLDKAQDAIIVCKLDREIVFWNRGAERIYGWTSAEALGKNVRELFFAGNVPPQLLEAEKCLETKGEWLGELQELTQGGKLVTVQARGTLVRDGRGEPKSLLLINTDITEHKLLEEQFLRAQRLESLGALVSGIAHDLNNTLVPIIIGVEILKTQTLAPDAASMLNTMESSARRSAEMVKQMLLFARGGESVKSLIRPDQLVKEMGKIITDTFPKSVNCRVSTGKNLRAVSAIPTQIHQVLMNLCVNARDAMSEKGTLTLTVENARLGAEAAAQQPGARPGEFVCISVGDTGTGIPPEQLGKIFKAFFTTKAPGKGTGLGLSTCQSIVKSHEGLITVHSEVGKGTEFKVYLPAADVKAPEQAVEDKATLPAGKGERILVVDDEGSILAMTRAALENYGYAVTTAVSGMEAVSRFRENPDAFNLVITDYAMPFMDGPAMIPVLRKIRPDVKIVMTTGAENQVKKLSQDSQIDGFVLKPFTTEGLLSITHRVLAGK
ncbi:MAG: PAS domain S-box protein [Verrucomicrobiae bacterium]|nr:PAS domain S-box protein [Verrucomicrobiae bacterium]